MLAADRGRARAELHARQPARAAGALGRGAAGVLQGVQPPSPTNADFAYNLAVSLDQLRQPKLALEYYRRALALAETRGARFDLAAPRRARAAGTLKTDSSRH